MPVLPLLKQPESLWLRWHFRACDDSPETVNSVVWATLRKNYCSINVGRHWASFPFFSFLGRYTAFLVYCSAQYDTHTSPLSTYSLTPDSWLLGFCPVMWNPTPGLMSYVICVFCLSLHFRQKESKSKPLHKGTGLLLRQSCSPGRPSVCKTLSRMLS